MSLGRLLERAQLPIAVAPAVRVSLGILAFVEWAGRASARSKCRRCERGLPLHEYGDPFAPHHSGICMRCTGESRSWNSCHTR